MPESSTENLDERFFVEWISLPVYHRLGDLTDLYFSQFWRLANLGSRYHQQDRFHSKAYSFGLCCQSSCCVLTGPLSLCLGGESGKRESPSSMVSPFIRTLILSDQVPILITQYNLNYFFKNPISKNGCMGFQHMILGKHKHLAHNSEQRPG